MSKVPKSLKIIAGVLGGLVVLMIIVTATNGDKKQENNTAQEPEKAQTASRCEDVPAVIISGYESGFNTKGLTLRNAKAVESKDFASAYFVSADIQGAGLESNEDIATFFTDSIEGTGGLVMSANNVAKEFFDFPDAATTDFKATMSNDGAKQSQDCAKQ